MKIGYRRNVGEVVSIKNYVGLIQMKNGFQIQVLPKISFGAEDEGNVQTKRVFLRMLRSMKDFPSKVFNDASLKVDQMNLYELFINMYLQEVRQLVNNSLSSLCKYIVQPQFVIIFKYCNRKLSYITIHIIFCDAMYLHKLRYFVMGHIIAFIQIHIQIF